MFNKSLTFLLVTCALKTTAFAQGTGVVPNCFGNLNQQGSYQIQFQDHTNSVNINEALNFLNISGFSINSVDYASQKALVNYNAHSFAGQKNAMAALQVLADEELVRKMSCVGFAGPRPRIGVAN